MELACVVSPVESYEDINNLSASINQNQDKNPNTNLGKIVWWEKERDPVYLLAIKTYTVLYIC